MAGAFLIGFIILGIIFFVTKIIDDYNDDFWNALSVACFIIAALMIMGIPMSHIDSKSDAAYAKVFQETLDYNRGNAEDLSVFERAAIMEEISTCNSKINVWKVKGEKWYHNKWYYHPDTQEVEFIK
jgi:hypothetical protein